MVPTTLTRPEPQRLFTRLADLRGRLRTAAALRGACLLAALALGGSTAAILLDRLVGLPAPARAVVLAGLLVGGVWLALTRLIRPLTRPADDLALALRIENAHPEFNDSLASAVQFLRGEADPAGREVRDAAVGRALRLAERTNFRDIVPGRDLSRAGLVLGGAAGLALLVGLLMPGETAATGLLRLADPFGDHPWPPSTRLEVLSPAGIEPRHPRGEPCDIRVRVSGVVPVRATITVKSATGVVLEEQAVALNAPPGESAEVALELKPRQVQQDFHFRVVANDGDTGWRTVRVLEPPRLAPLAGRPSPQIRLAPPAYAALPDTDQSDGSCAFTATLGTTARVRAAVNRPVTSARVEYRPGPNRPDLAATLAASGAEPLHAAGTTGVTAAIGVVAHGVVAPDGLSFEVEFRPALAGTYALVFADETGLPGVQPLDVRVPPDGSPRVRLDRPARDRDSLALLPTAALTVAAVADDAPPEVGLPGAVRSLWLEVRAGRDELARRVPLYPGKEPTRQPGVGVERRLELATITHADGSPLKEGDIVTLAAVADDFDDVSAGKSPGRSAEVELQIIGPAALDALVQAGQNKLRADVLKLEAAQRAASKLAADAEQNLKRGPAKPDDLEALLQAEQAQRAIRDTLADPERGLRADVERLRQLLRDNNQPAAKEERLAALDEAMQRLGREELEPVEPLLARARKEAETPSDDPARRNAALQEARQHQEAAERGIRELLKELEPWSGANEVRGEARSLLQEMRRIADETKKLADEHPELTGKRRENLTADQQDALDRLANRQERAATRAEAVLEKLRETTRAKEATLREKLAAAERKLGDAEEKELEAKNTPDTPDGALDRTRLEAEAKKDRADEAELREAAADLKRELDALKQAERAARLTEDKPKPDPTAPLGPDTPDTPPPTGDDTRKAAEAARDLRDNRLGKARDNQSAAEKSLERLAERLDDKQRADQLERLGKKVKDAKQELADLTARQERLQKKMEAAARLTDAGERRQELERLTREQDQLRKESRELAERLSRMRAGEAGRELTRAARQMDRAGEQTGADDPDAAIESTDDTLDRLDETARALEKREKELAEELQREQLAKMADTIRGLRERQIAATAEADRLEEAGRKAKGWPRELKDSLARLANAQKAVAAEADSLAEKRFESVPVFDKLLRQSADAMRQTVKAIDGRVVKGTSKPENFDPAKEDVTRSVVRRTQGTALRRLDQLLDALKPDPEAAKAGGPGEKPPAESEPKNPKEPGGKDPSKEPARSARGSGDGMPPTAQLRALRALQAEVNELTAKFATDHPDAAKLTPDELAELQAIRQTQADVAALVRKLTPEPEEKP